jgi:KipI family sensor histidine kinase inhibitor
MLLVLAELESTVEIVSILSRHQSADPARCILPGEQKTLLKADNLSPSVEPASDHSLLVTFSRRICPEANGRVRKLFAALEARQPAGMTNLHPAYSSLLVDFDPLRISLDVATGAVCSALKDDALPEEAGRLVEIPVLYGGNEGPDINDVAAACRLTVEEVVRRHCAPEYLVYFLGFSPGFPYLGGMDPALATPRLDSPRKLVPAGSVAIGGSQTGIYPAASPGGWRIIGRTPLRLFDPKRRQPTLLEMGCRVRFLPISNAEPARRAKGLLWSD